MNIGLIIIVIVAISLILGPIMMLRPNPVQKNKENLRSLARAAGVHFSIRNLPQQADEQEKPAPVPVYFIPPEKPQLLASWMLVRTNYEHDVNFLGWWAWRGDARANSAEQQVLSEQLGNLPESIRAVSGGGDDVSVYWEEKGGEEVLQQVLLLLKSLKASTPNQA
ncbi:MAG: hypothetical protein EOO53_04235 [Gammaproteobacteria bacterium]|nr:MAG: hypothetical protein EOO53_04235 [Gammaproteobacteria bacterium]